MGCKCKFRTDDDGHHYIVPSDRVEEFDALMEKGWEAWTPEESKRISSCSTGGAPPDVEFEWPQEITTIRDGHIIIQHIDGSVSKGNLNCVAKVRLAEDG